MMSTIQRPSVSIARPYVARRTVRAVTAAVARLADAPPSARVSAESCIPEATRTNLRSLICHGSKSRPHAAGSASARAPAPRQAPNGPAGRCRAAARPAGAVPSRAERFRHPWPPPPRRNPPSRAVVSPAPGNSDCHRPQARASSADRRSRALRGTPEPTAFGDSPDDPARTAQLRSPEIALAIAEAMSREFAMDSSWKERFAERFWDRLHELRLRLRADGAVPAGDPQHPAPLV